MQVPRMVDGKGILEVYMVSNTRLINFIFLFIEKEKERIRFLSNKLFSNIFLAFNIYFILFKALILK